MRVSVHGRGRQTVLRRVVPAQKIVVPFVAPRIEPSVRAARGFGSDLGAATAEYAVVTVAAAGLGGILIKLLTSDWFLEILKTILETVIRAALSFFGIGG